jgi:hypothetical protein
MSTLHGPVPLPANTAALGVGLGPVFLGAPIDEDMVMLGLYASARHAHSDRLELGASIGVFNGLAADVKYVLVPGPFSVAVNMAISTDIFEGTPGFHPAVLVGTERVYGGAKQMVFTEGYLGPITVLFVGGSFGGRTRLVPEIAWLRDASDGEVAWIVGLKLQQRVGSIGSVLGNL